MSTGSDSRSEVPQSPEAQDKCRVAVVYEDIQARERAVSLSHHLMDQFWQELEFEFSWWRFRFLEDPEIAEAAAEAATHADIVVVSAAGLHPPPIEVRDWITVWAPHRGGNPGVLLPLLEPSTPEDVTASPWLSLLEDVAEISGMECLVSSQLRDSPLFTDPVRRLQQRAHHVSGVLDQILHTLGKPPAPPPQWGLNE